MASTILQDVADVEGARQPLLADSCQADDNPPSPALKEYKGCTASEATFNLAITAVGAGILALPKAFASVGLVVGLVVVACAAVFTYCSATVITVVASKTHLPTYGCIIKAKFGRAGAMLLQSSIVLHVGGAMIVYLMIIADILVGVAPNYNGVLCELLNRHDGVWWLSRNFVILVLVVAVEVPLYSLRNMALLSKASGACVCITLYMAGFILFLAGLAWQQGKLAADVYVWPNEDTFEHLWGGNVLAAVRGVLGSLAVAALAYTCHFNLIPVQRSMKHGFDNRPPCMKRIVAHAVLLCAALYAAVGGSGYIMFGSATRGDVLKNINLQYVRGLLGRHWAHLLVTILGLTYPINLLVNFALRLWGLRENIVGLLFDMDAMRLPLSTFYMVTYASLVMVFALSVAVPSVWFLVEVIGSTACMVFAYVFPALLLATGEAGGGAWGRAGGAGLLLVAAVVAVFGTINAFASLG